MIFFKCTIQHRKIKYCTSEKETIVEMDHKSPTRCRTSTTQKLVPNSKGFERCKNSRDSEIFEQRHLSYRIAVHKSSLKIEIDTPIHTKYIVHMTKVFLSKYMNFQREKLEVINGPIFLIHLLSENDNIASHF